MFPSAANTNSEDKKHFDENPSWLQPVSFHQEASSAYQSEDHDSDKSDQGKPSIEKDEPKKKRKRKAPKEDKLFKEKVKSYISSKTFLDELPALAQHEAFVMDKRGDSEFWTQRGTPATKRSKYYCKIHTMLGQEDWDPLPPKSTGTVIPHRQWVKGRYFSKKFTKKLLKNDGAIMENAQQPVSEEERKLLLDQVAHLNAAVRAKPNDIAAWLTLVAMQLRGAALLSHEADRNLGKERDAEKDISTSTVGGTQRLILEKQLEILEQALHSNASNVALRVCFLQLVARHWDAMRLTREWATFNATRVNDLRVWRWNVFNCLSCHIATFHCDKVTEKMQHAVVTFIKMLAGKIASHRVGSHVLAQLVDFFYTYCEWLRLCGHEERFIASWQAAMEFACFHPQSDPQLARYSPHGDVAGDAKVECFENFWQNSGAARFGVPGARGWARWWQFCQRTGQQDHLIQEELEEELNGKLNYKNAKESFEWWARLSILQDQLCESEDTLRATATSSHLNQILKPSFALSSTPLVTSETPETVASLGHVWLHLERLREGVHWSPALSTEEARVDEDPQRVVLPDEVIPTCLLPICGEGSIGPDRDRESVATLTRRRQLALLCAMAWRVPVMCWGSHGDASRLVLCNVGLEIMHNSELEQVSWLQELHFTSQGYQEPRSPDRGTWREFVHSSLVQMQQSPLLMGETSVHGEACSRWWHCCLSVLMLRLHFHQIGTDSSQQFVTESKKLLAQPWSQDNLRLWTEYGLLLWCQGSLKASRKVFDNCLRLFSMPQFSETSVLSSTGGLERHFQRLHLLTTYLDLEMGCHPSQCLTVARASFANQRPSSQKLGLLLTLALSPSSPNPTSSLSAAQILILQRTADRTMASLVEEISRDIQNTEASSTSTSWEQEASRGLRLQLLHSLTYALCCVHLVLRQDLDACQAALERIISLFQTQIAPCQHSQAAALWAEELCRLVQRVFCLLHVFRSVSPLGHITEVAQKLWNLLENALNFTESTTTSMTEKKFASPSVNVGPPLKLRLRSPLLCTAWLLASQLLNPAASSLSLTSTASSAASLGHAPIWTWWKWKKRLHKLAILLNSHWPLAVVAMLELRRLLVMNQVLRQEGVATIDTRRLAVLLESYVERELYEVAAEEAGSLRDTPLNSSQWSPCLPTEPGDSFETSMRRLLWHQNLVLAVHQWTVLRGRQDTPVPMLAVAEKRALGVFYRAVQVFPFDKSLYQKAIFYFPARVQELVDIMTEKGLRVRAPVDEVELLLTS